METPKEYDIVLYGATGFTGALTAEYFAEIAEIVPSGSESPSQTDGKPKIRLAIAGRNVSKLEEIKEKMIKMNPSCKNVDILVGDAVDQQAVDNIVKKAKVLLTTAGPFRKYGPAIVDACVRFKTDYCDITGETGYARSIIDRYDEDAKRRGVKIIPFCGFDSIPSDLGAFIVADYIKNKLNRQCNEVTCVFGPMKGAASGGTIATVMDVMENGTKASRHPYALCPEVKGKRAPSDFFLVSYEKRLKRWTAPFFMAVANTRVVRRSAYLDPNLYGNNFQYREVMGTKSLLVAFLTSVFMVVSVAILAVPPLRSVAKRFVTQPGSGPSLKQRKEGHFTATILGTAASLGSDDKPQVVQGVIKAKGDPGYEVTRKFVAESALCMALQRDQLPKSYGIVTPASGMGRVLVDRLNKVEGISLQVTGLLAMDK